MQNTYFFSTRFVYSGIAWFTSVYYTKTVNYLCVQDLISVANPNFNFSVEMAKQEPITCTFGSVAKRVSNSSCLRRDASNSAKQQVSNSRWLFSFFHSTLYGLHRARNAVVSWKITIVSILINLGRKTIHFIVVVIVQHSYKFAVCVTNKFNPM